MRALASLVVLLLLAGCTAALRGPALSPAQQLGRCLQASVDGDVYLFSAQPAAVREEAQLWNRLYSNSTPIAVVRPATVDGVAAAVKCAYATGIKVVPKCGGHSFMGYSMRDGTLGIDLSRLNKVTVSADRQTARVQGGTKQGQMYYAVWKQAGNNTAVVGGTCPTVGVGGFLQGGGLGFFTAQYGLACDLLVGIEMIDYKGRLVRANQHHNRDLLRAMCGGGGGNFGIVTEFLIRLVQVPPLMTTYQFTLKGNQTAVDFFLWFQSHVLNTASHKLAFDLRLSTTGKGVAQVQGNLRWPGREAEMRAELAALGLLGPSSPWTPHFTKNVSFEAPWIQMAMADDKSAFKKTGTPEDLLQYEAIWAGRSYLKEKSYCSLAPLPAATLAQLFQSLARSKTAVLVHRLGPKTAFAQVPPQATAFPWRKALFCLQHLNYFTSPEEATRVIAGLNDARDILAPHLPGLPGYVNYIDQDISPNPLFSYYGHNLGWLREVKQQYDPEGRLSTNPLSIPPADRRNGWGR